MSMMRRTLLALSTNAWLRERATKADFVRAAVRQFMPGETIDDALRAAREQQGQRINAIVTRLGENITRIEEGTEVTEHYLEVLDKIAAAGLDTHVSVKPTQLGLDQDVAVCRRNLDRIIERTDARDNFLWIDMESSPYVDPTLDLFRYGRTRTAKIGVAIQAYLYRSMKDIESLIPNGCAIRVVKGAYLEPDHVAYPRKADVDENFFKLCVRLLQPDALASGCLVHIGTHDMVLVERLRAWIAANAVPASAYEFAMLYGIRRADQQKLASEGQRLRVLISYGEYWFPWYMRRLAERPANVWFVVKSRFA
jgi:proline dehydrogenase